MNEVTQEGENLAFPGHPFSQYALPLGPPQQASEASDV